MRQVRKVCLPADEGQRILVQVQNGDCCCDDGCDDDHHDGGPQQETAAFLNTHKHIHLKVQFDFVTSIGGVGDPPARLPPLLSLQCLVCQF